jgi:hypothetical protein
MLDDKWKDQMSDTTVVLLSLAAICYFLPTLIAMSRGKANGTVGVFFVNLVAGWTVLGWFASFIWACSGETDSQIARRDRQHRELLAATRGEVLVPAVVDTTKWSAADKKRLAQSATHVAVLPSPSKANYANALVTSAVLAVGLTALVLSWPVIYAFVRGVFGLGALGL